MCLVLIASASAYGLQLVATAMVPSAALPDQYQVSSTIVTRRVLIVAVDPDAGDVTQVECDAPAYSFAVDTIVVDAHDLAGTASVCNRRFAPDMSP
jgi:hypothetical protein